MRTFTIFAIYHDNNQPYTTTVQAEDEKSACAKAQEQAVVDNGWQGIEDDPLIVAGVLEGEFVNLI